MTVTTRKLSLAVVSVIAVLAMLFSQALLLPQQTAFAAGTDLYVGYSGKNNNFSTVQEAVNKAASINPSSEANRVTIHIAPGTYREQIIVQTPFVSFVNDEPSKEVKLTWYYGIGYKYYSANSKGYYDANLARSKSGKNIANYRWGATVQLWPNATNFKAQDITFENSFNRYITNEELADGVECTGETLNVQRTSGSDVNSKALTERAAAFSADAGYCEFLNCKFLSSQDTLYTGGSPQYYKNCLIEGQTDYIFGDSSAVFDSCELRWKGYSSGSTGGYITAARDENDADTGYLFTNCRVTANSGLTVSTGYLGRPWRDTAKVMFINTTLASSNMIAAEGWYSMSGVQPESVAGFKENGTKLSNGQKVDLSKRKGHIVSDSDAANINIINYMKNWTPSIVNASSGSQQTDPQPTTQQGSTNVNDKAITKCGGWFETGYAEWDSSAIGSNVQVSYATSGSSVFTQVDSVLIRGNRVDIPGLKGNTEYTIKIVGSSASATAVVKTMSYDRSGYAHYNYSSGVGAYNNDGTLKTGVQVIYVTNSNKNNITYGGQTGLYNIFYSAKPKNVVFRFIGSIDVPNGAKANDGKQNDGSSMLYLQHGENVTIEGIGYNANLNQWGFEMKRCTGCEVRNLWLGKYPDDGVSMTGDSSSMSSHMWIHNNTIEKGYNQYAGNGTVDDDKADGDGSVDIKWSEYVTVSYNVFKDCHKTSLVGGGTNHMQDYITYHHNWFNNTESRNPRARNAHVHSYNNYFYNNKQYGIGASYNSKVFSEANYYENTYLPLDAVNMGSDAYSGTIKSFNDKFDGCNMGSGLAYKIVYSRTEAANIGNLKSGGDGYDNFDLNMYSYNPQSADAAKAEVKANAGRMDQYKTYSAGTVQSGEQSQPQQPVSASGKLITEFNVTDYTYGSAWSVAQNTKQGDKAFGDRDFLITSLPAMLNGAERVVTACDSKNTDADLANFKAGKDITVYVAIDQRVSGAPSWLWGWNTELQTLSVTDASAERYFTIYSREFSEVDKIVLGTNGQSAGVMHYLAFVQERETIVTTTEAPTEPPTTTQTETVTTEPVVNVRYGDANCDGRVTLGDALAVLQYVANEEKYPLSEEGLNNADIYLRGDGITSMDAVVIQQIDTGLITEDSLPVSYK